MADVFHYTPGWPLWWWSLTSDPWLNRRTWPTCLDIWGPSGSVVGTFCHRACCSSAEMAAASHSEPSDSWAQVLPENEKTKRIECQSNWGGVDIDMCCTAVRSQERVLGGAGGTHRLCFGKRWIIDLKSYYIWFRVVSRQEQLNNPAHVAQLGRR